MKTFKEFGEFFKAHHPEKLSTTSFAAAVFGYSRESAYASSNG